MTPTGIDPYPLGSGESGIGGNPTGKVLNGTAAGQIPTWNPSTGLWEPANGNEPPGFYGGNPLLTGVWTELSRSAKFEIVAEHTLFEARKLLGGTSAQLRGMMKIKAAEEIKAGEELFKFAAGFFNAGTIFGPVAIGSSVLNSQLTVSKAGVASLNNALAAGTSLCIDNVIVSIN